MNRAKRILASIRLANSMYSTQLSRTPHRLFHCQTKLNIQKGLFPSSNGGDVHSVTSFYRDPRAALFQRTGANSTFPCRNITTLSDSVAHDTSPSHFDAPPRIKFKRLDKTARHIMQIVDKEAVEEVRATREIPDIRPGFTIQLKVEVPENKRRVSTIKGTVIARRNAGINTTFRLRRMVGTVGVECLYPLYSPNIKEIKVLEKKKVRRAKLYYVRDRKNLRKL